ncbi:MAG TPA: YigZ family protein [Saprospiraceae bacterium]|nr:YigZ family protein [Saprospiraceae bacterium]HPN68871.1 YigZ family protein [Saprospiraceae bacterium]
MEAIKDSYFTIEDVAQGEYKEKGSKFLAYAYSFDDTNQLSEIIKTLKSEHPKARHHCFAYQVGINGEEHRAFDDGEPSGTAGKPILGQIKSKGVTNVLVVVVRYFGGTKLGASGLIQAYKLAAQEALESAAIVEKFVSTQYLLETGYDKMGFLLNVLKKLDLDIVEKNFDTNVQITIRLRKSVEFEKLKILKADLLELSLDQIDEGIRIAWCEILKKPDKHL